MEISAFGSEKRKIKCIRFCLVFVKVRAASLRYFSFAYITLGRSMLNSVASSKLVHQEK